MPTEVDDDALPPFDPKQHCVKCGNEIADPEPPQKAGPDGQMMVTGPAPSPEPPNVTYCDGLTCPWFDDPELEEEDIEEHMHAVCTVCGYEWLTKTLDAA